LRYGGGSEGFKERGRTEVERSGSPEPFACQELTRSARDSHHLVGLLVGDKASISEVISDFAVKKLASATRRRDSLGFLFLRMEESRTNL